MFETEYTEIQDEKCFSCRFCVLNGERGTDGCSVKGCVDHSKYIEYKGVYDERKKKYV
jgi:hypothetical protein